MIKNVKKKIDEKPKFVKKISKKIFFNVFYHIDSLNKDIQAYSTSFFASEPQQFTDLSEIVMQQFIESQEFKNSVLLFHPYFTK